ncbi:MAG: hypothetical protein KZQ64_04855 [gamma proteobacterium symbiont of Bathyaustriella thionipta]|nr:hypothetical protein [gamma proteobacterium symbiont of Bathyaustriella thionipta]MCU7948483.1 hypothetical protein [gamma proteobacterium symbiont of Bathyaustriella thionipta]MCU7952707.1 hypothetical protein [gamma proteobacterium symbiont of Bathyaustriella thionipta]MCU7957503.1 hypothetical protein [gamma proteobacterium symbiont of Bathyaustriella thionipta]MCU7966350.1 hypothetical protein [gamma proteobacterium symbiont of Bathyaustriella thionipta]
MALKYLDYERFKIEQILHPIYTTIAGKINTEGITMAAVLKLAVYLTANI